MNQLISLIQAHETVSALIAYYVISAAIGALPSPTATSSPFYQFVFKFLNTIGGNLTRAFSNTIEGSPNFQPAVNLQQKLAGQEPTPVVIPPPKP